MENSLKKSIDLPLPGYQSAPGYDADYHYNCLSELEPSV